MHKPAVAQAPPTYSHFTVLLVAVAFFAVGLLIQPLWSKRISPAEKFASLNDQIANAEQRLSFLREQREAQDREADEKRLLVDKQKELRAKLAEVTENMAKQPKKEREPTPTRTRESNDNNNKDLAPLDAADPPVRQPGQRKITLKGSRKPGTDGDGNGDGNGAQTPEQRWCIEKRDKFHVRIGEDWGDMPRSDMPTWEQYNCNALAMPHFEALP